MAHYYITGVWLNDDRKFTHVNLHQVHKDGSWGRGEKTKVTEVRNLIEIGAVVMTGRWDYQKAAWDSGAPVLVTSDFRRKLQSPPDAPPADRLENMLRMTVI